ncbi:MAG: glycosyltransferase family 2 protein [Patescibacteria group bacterium]
MEKISACLVVCNEEKLIGRCLESLKGAVDEIILVHDGPCQDRTLEIAAEYGAKIFVRPFYGVAEGQRPFSYEKASHEWILQIDADEFLSAELSANLKILVSNNKVDAYKVIWPIWDGSANKKGSWPEKIILFRKRAVVMWGIPHFVPRISGKVIKTNFRLFHQPLLADLSIKGFFQKQSPWARQQAFCYLQDFSNIIKFNEIRTSWPWAVRIRRRFPLFLTPIEFIWTYGKNIIGGAYLAGFPGFKSAFLLACYRANVNYYMYKLKHDSK